MIKELIAELTPYIYNGRKLYDENDIELIVEKTVQKYTYKNDNFEVVSGQLVEQYPEATC